MKHRKLTPLGRKIKKALVDKQMTQVELGIALGVSPKYINLIIHGERSGEKYLEQIFLLLDMK
ncbi:MAG: helix-turn-helix domain protein [Clostridiales bacterium]|jgi:transcriptional regulator with XRE-family HTH domain|nr:helix-turn-helix domain protein [Clostridiales bacterium]